MAMEGHIVQSAPTGLISSVVFRPVEGLEVQCDSCEKGKLPEGASREVKGLQAAPKQTTKFS